VFENHSYKQIIGSSSAPYFNQLAGKCGLATNATALRHPSLPNYIGLTSGSTQGITDDGSPSKHPHHILTIVVAPPVHPGARSGTAYTHYSLLRTTEEMFGLGLLGKAGSAASMRAGFGL
jgi:hypothetical protein